MHILIVRVRGCWGNVVIKEEVDRALNASREKTKVTRESMTKQFDEDREFARENGSPSAAVTASASKAKLYGLFIDRSVNMKMDLDTASDEEVLERAKFELAEACKLLGLTPKTLP